LSSERHRGQTRKNAAKSPYITHIHAVLAILREEGGVTDEDILVAAALHDTVKDTATTFDEVGERFGRAVPGVVRDMTDDKACPSGAQGASDAARASSFHRRQAIENGGQDCQRPRYHLYAAVRLVSRTQARILRLGRAGGRRGAGE
jgi:guanosine-3',5'-bis(diphosphate) 3'-pyrophosphohydrolase